MIVKYKVLLGVSFGVALTSSLVAHVPASWAWQQVPKLASLQISGIDGTLWQGQAAQVRWQGKNLGRMQWDMRVLPLLMGSVKLDVRFGQGSDMGLTGRGVVGYRSAGPFAENLLVSVPATEMMQFAPSGVPVTVAGNLELTLRDYQFAAPYCETLEGTLAWSGAEVSSPLGGLNPGPVIADLSCDNGKVLADMKQDSPQVMSQWNVSLAQGNNYALAGWFKPGAEFPPQLGQQLKWLGSPDPKGQYRITYSGRF